MNLKKIMGVLAVAGWLFVAASLVTNPSLAAGSYPAPLVQGYQFSPEPDLSAVDKIDPEVSQAILAAPAAANKIPIIITLKAQADLSAIQHPERDLRLQAVIQALQETALTTQGPIKAFLADKRKDGSAGPVTAFWVFNGLAVPANGAVIAQLVNRPDVLRVSLDESIPAPGALDLNQGVEWNIELVNAPALWDLGLRGQGIVVANLDTGVSVNHPDLAGRWRGGSNSWFDPYGENATPTDLNGHGTQTMGLIVGGTGGGSAFGVAPEAQWIAAKIFSNQGSATVSGIHRSFQWLLDPDGNPATPDAPHVVNNSWNFSGTGCNLEFEFDLQALRAAGILPVFAAGNAGPSAGVNSSPANNPSAFAVSATDLSNQVYYYSSRGPSACGDAAPLFPHLSSPGVDVLTSSHYGGYQISSGTSLAAPHIAGGLALLLSSNPNLTAAEQQAALLASAVDLGPAGADTIFGSGLLDLLAAFNITAGPPPQPTPTPTEPPAPSPTFTPTATTVPPTSTPFPSEPTPTPAPNLALGKLASVSSSQDSSHTGSQAVDGSLATYWQSKKLARPKNTNEWIQLDLGSPATLQQVVLKWNAYYATQYTLQASLDGSTWSSLASATGGSGGTETISFAPTQARYLKLESQAWNDSLYRCWLAEFEVYGSLTEAPLPTPTSTSSPVPSATPTPPPSNQASLHISDLDGASGPGIPNRWNASVTITVSDESGALVPNAQVSGAWSGGASSSASCTTGSQGQCSLTLSNLKTTVGSVTFSVRGIAHSILVYQPADNHDPDGDSDGTKITIFRP